MDGLARQVAREAGIPNFPRLVSRRTGVDALDGWASLAIIRNLSSFAQETRCVAR